METNVILKYKRERECWICGECDSENSIVTSVCSVCNSSKKPDDWIVSAWRPEDDIVITVTPDRTKVVSADAVEKLKDMHKGMHIEEFGRYDTEESSGKTVAIWIGVLAAVIIFIILMAQANG